VKWVDNFLMGVLARVGRGRTPPTIQRKMTPTYRCFTAERSPLIDRQARVPGMRQNGRNARPVSQGEGYADLLRKHHQMVDEETGKVVDKDEKGRGFAISKGRYVEIDEDELESALGAPLACHRKQFECCCVVRQ